MLAKEARWSTSSALPCEVACEAWRETVVDPREAHLLADVYEARSSSADQVDK